MEEYRTKSGKLLTEEELDGYVAEAEIGYKVEDGKVRPNTDDPDVRRRVSELSDAIALERAAGVLQRRFPADKKLTDGISAKASALRIQAETDG